MGKMKQTNIDDFFKIKHLKRTPLIRYPRFKQLLEEILNCHSLTIIAGEPNCMSLEGQPGVGKSTLLKDILAMFPPVETETGTEIPIFYVETPSPVTVKGLASY